MSSESNQSKWFGFAGIAVGLGGLCLLHLLRISQVRADMDRRLAEEDRIAQQAFDALLQDVLGLILKTHAGVAQIPREEPARQTLEEILDQFDRIMAETANRVRRPPLQ